MALTEILRHGYKEILGAIILLGLSLVCNSDFSSNKYEQPAFEIVSSENIKHGRNYLSQLRKWSETAQCWHEALMQFQRGCKHLSSIDQSRLAISLTNCHLAQSGHPIFPCSNNQSIEECTQTMDKADFIIYTEFFTNSISICFFIRNQQWQENTEFIINQLSISSLETAKKLKKSLQYHEQLLQKQHNSLENQKLIIQNERLLKESIKNSTEDMTDILAKTNSKAQENYQTIRAAFSSLGNNLRYLTSLQMLLLGEFSTIYTSIYYVIGVSLAYLLTTTPSTANARIWLYLVLTINVIFERVLTAILHSYRPVDNKIKDTIYSTTWIGRRIFIGICTMILVISYIKYRDYKKINNALLEKITKQNMEIKALLNNKSPLAKEDGRLLSDIDSPNAITQQNVEIKALLNKKLLFPEKEDTLPDVDSANENSSAKILNKHLGKQMKRNQQHQVVAKSKNLSSLRDSGISDDCESDFEMRAIVHPETSGRLKPKSVVNDTKKIPNGEATPERMTRSPTRYNLRQQFGYKMNATKRENSTVKPSRKEKRSNSVKSSRGLPSAKMELFSEED
ncbi:Protein brambleberry [Trichoplax sp. H2]|nr:Protein brambleberry [Trichoplax sp. H2]|eukprot:RDD38876.1 Protein brambleberry [Trichoplax sp. H2]